jgi:hypothetical protein
MERKPVRFYAEKSAKLAFPNYYHRVEDDIDDWVVENCLLGEHQRKHGVDRRDLL